MCRGRPAQWARAETDPAISTHLKLGLDGKLEGETAEVEQKQVALAVIDARVGRAERLVHLLYRRRHLRGAEHTASVERRQTYGHR